MTRLALVLAMSLWCQYAYEVVWYEMMDRFLMQPSEWSEVTRALCDAGEASGARQVT